MKQKHQHLPTADSKRRVRAPLPEQVDVAVIGAGTGGLTAAAYLAAAGLKVAVFDSHYVAGGAATQFARKVNGGHLLFDIGLHYMGDCEPGGLVHRILEPLGIHQEFVQMPADGYDTLLFPDFTFRVPADIDLYRQRQLDLFPSERRGIDRFIRLVRNAGRIAHEVFDTQEIPDLRTAYGILTRSPHMIFDQHRTIRKLIDSYTKNDRLKAVWLAPNGEYGVPASEASALIHAVLVEHYLRGAWYPKGGGQSISDRLADRIEQNGGSIHLRRGIERILVEGKRVVGVRTEAGSRQEAVEVRARVVVSNADLQKTMLELLGPEHLPRRVVRRAENWIMGGYTFMTCLGVDTDMRAKGMTSCNYMQFDNYDMEIDYRTGHETEGYVPSNCYITSSSLKDPDTSAHAPAGITVLEVMSQMGKGPAGWGIPPEQMIDGSYRKNPLYLERKQAVEDNMVDRLESIFPGTREHIIFCESATPASHARFTRASDGATYGLAAIPAQFNLNRPSPRGPLKGLYFCGQSVRPSHGILGVMRSGRLAAAMIAKELRVRLPGD